MKIQGNTIWWMLCLILIVWSCRNDAVIHYENDAVPPADGVSTYKVAEGFQLELIASEPLIHFLTIHQAQSKSVRWSYWKLPMRVEINQQQKVRWEGH